MAVAASIDLGQLLLVGHQLAAATASTGGTGTQVYITDIGGANIVQVPEAAIVHVSWSDGRTQDATATLIVKRWHLLDPEDPGSWLANEFTREREVMIVDEGRVVIWGPILSKRRAGGGGTLTLPVSGAEYWMNRVLIATAAAAWSREWLQNPDFAQGLAGWTAIMGPTINGTGGETGGPAVELGVGRITQTVPFSLEPEWQVLVRARAYVEAAVPDAEVLLTLEHEGLAYNVRRTVTAGDVTRDQWTWITAQVTMRGTGAPAVSLDLTLSGDGTGAGEVTIDTVTMQVSAESLGIPGQPPRARFLTQRLAFQSVVNNLAEFNVHATADIEGRTMAAPWADRGDVYVSEGVRHVTSAADGVEWRMEYTTATRIAAMTDLVGVEHNPATLTISQAEGTLDGLEDWTTGLTPPTTEWVVMGEDGFTGSYRNESAFGGRRLQQLIEAPIGTAIGELETLAAEAARESSEELNEQMTIRVPASLRHTLHWGDRVHLTVDDGPDQFDGLVRVESRDINPKAATMRLTVTEWVEP